MANKLGDDVKEAVSALERTIASNITGFEIKTGLRVTGCAIGCHNTGDRIGSDVVGISISHN